MSSPQVVISPTPQVLAEAAAARLITAIIDAQSVRDTARIVLTGGSSGIGVLAAIAASAAKDAVDWGSVDFWWGDERFVAADDRDRNDLQAREALLDSLPLDPKRVHAFPALDGPLGDDPDAAAAAYAAELADHADDGSIPRFDVLMLGVGEEGHIASIFPESPAAYDEGTVCAVRDCPKPPPTRLSMTFGALSSANEVWFMTSGAAKAEAVAHALQGVPRDQVPAAGPKGLSRTLWLLDVAAASELPAG